MMKIAIVSIAGLVAVASAQVTQSVECFANATVYTTGNRTGSNNDAFFNIDGADPFASYGVARFNTAAVKAAFDAAFGAGNWNITAIDLATTQQNASFTRNGNVIVFFSPNDTTDLAPGGFSTNPWPLDRSAAGLYGPLETLTTYTFTQVSNGFAEFYNVLATNLANDIKNDSTNLTTLVFDANDTGVVATYAGFSNFNSAGPTLSITAVQASNNVAPNPFAIESPAPGSYTTSNTVVFDFEDSAFADSYAVEIATDADFNDVIIIQSGMITSEATVNNLPDGVLYARAFATNAFGITPSTNVVDFAVVTGQGGGIDCRPDFDDNGALNIFDIFGFFNQFGAGC